MSATHRTLVLRRKRIALCLATALLAHSVGPAPAVGSDEALSNGDFASGLEQWVVEGSPGSPAAVHCSGSDCLEIGVPPSGRASARQAVGPLEPGGAYRVEARLRAETLHLVRLSLYDPNWGGPYCARKPLSVFVETAGTGDWQSLGTTLVIPERDPCGPTRDHQWQLRIEFEAHGSGTTSVLLDRMSLVKLAAPQAGTERRTAPLCSYFRDYDYTDPCPGDIATPVENASKPQITTVAKWMLDEGAGALIHDAVAGRNGVVELAHGDTKPDWRDGALFFSGGPNGPRVRVDAGQPIDGKRFEISLDVSPAANFTAGCLLASQPAGTRLGGFRLCLSQTTQVLSFEMSQGTSSAEYAAFLPTPIAPGRWTRVRIRGERNLLQVFVGGQRVEEFRVPRLRLRKSPHAFVIGADVRTADRPDAESGFRGKIRNVTLRSAANKAPPRRKTPLGYVTRGRWPLDEGTGKVVRDRASSRHGVIEDAPNRHAPRWRGNRLHFRGTPDAGGVVIQNAGPVYGDDFQLELEVMFDAPKQDAGTLLANKTGSSTQGGFMIDYVGWSREFVMKFANGKRQVSVRTALPFTPPANEWIPVRVHFAFGQLQLGVANVEIETFELNEFELAVSRNALIVGAYYYAPSKGIRGSIRNIAFHMREESISEDEDFRTAHAKRNRQEDCHALPLREQMVVGSNMLVPNWLVASCEEEGKRDMRVPYIVDMPLGFELVASGSSAAERGELVGNRVEKLDKRKRNGADYQRYRVELSYIKESGGLFGPLFIAATKHTATERRARTVQPAPRPRMFFRASNAPDDESPRSVELETREFPALPPAREIHHSLAWMGLPHSMSWPNFFTHYRALGFNVVPTLAIYDQWLSAARRREFLLTARREGFELLVLDSPYHRMIAHEEARTLTSDGTRQPFLDPSYRGTYYDAELDRISTRMGEVEPEWYMMDIECFRDGAYACLIGTSNRCTEYLAAQSSSYSTDPAEAVTDLGNELITNIRHTIEKALPGRDLPRIGINTSEPNQTYHWLFDFNKLHGQVIDYAQPIFYRQHPDHMGERMRDIRLALPDGDVIPWVDPGSVEEFPSEQVYDRVLEIFGSGARGIAWFTYSRFEGSDFWYMAKALESVIAVESVIAEGKPLGEITSLTGGAKARGISSGPHNVLLVSSYEPGTNAGTITLRLPSGIHGTLWDVARQQKVGEIRPGEPADVSFEWRPALNDVHTALYYLGPASYTDGRFSFQPESSATASP
ncbi:MAG: hypothetical protein GY944_23650 [bacterium]|nr:hypothetical protein [bacterium]